MYLGLHIKYPLFSSDFNETWIFSADFVEILQYQVSWKSVQLEPICSLPTDGRTDRQNSRFSKFMNVPVNQEDVWESAGMAERDISG
jgi:hypothetical protein